MVRWAYKRDFYRLYTSERRPGKHLRMCIAPGPIVLGGTIYLMDIALRRLVPAQGYSLRKNAQMNQCRHLSIADGARGSRSFGGVLSHLVRPQPTLAVISSPLKCLSIARHAYIPDADARASTTPTSSTSTIVAFAEDAGAGTVVQDDAPIQVPDSDTHCLPPSRRISTRWTRSPRPSSHVPRTTSRIHELRVLSRVIRRVDRELTAQGVTNVRLTQLVRATHKRWSPASSKAYRPRRVHEQHSVMPHPKHVLAFQCASDLAIDIDADVNSRGD